MLGTQRRCNKWFCRFKSSEFDDENNERGGRPKVYEGVELEALLDEEHARTIGVTNKPRRLKLLKSYSDW